MNWKSLPGLLLLLMFSCYTYAQDTLPSFTVRDLGKGRIQISWINPYESVTQLNVQRSFDSLRGFKTIFSPQSPELVQNGFVDNKIAEGVKVYYRIFFVLEGGTYFFTPAKRPPTGFAAPVVPGSEGQLITIRLKDEVIAELNFDEYKLFRDSIVYQTRDTLYALSATEIVIKPYAVKEMWKPSQYIYTNRNGYISIYLPFANTRHYRIVFFAEDGSLMFEIPRVKETSLTLDKANFLRAGWYLFDLYEEGKLKERNKFFVPKDVR